MPFEDPGKMKFAFESAGEGDFSDAHRSGGQKRFCPAEAAFQEKLSGRQPCELLEKSAEVDVGE